MGWWFKMKLWQRVIIMLGLGVVFGLVLANQMGQAEATAWIDGHIRWVGLAFIRLIRMLIVPLIFTTLVAGVVAMGDPGKLGSLGLKTLALYMVTTLFANVIGMFFGVWLKPGEGADLGSVVVSGPPPSTEVDRVEQFLSFIPENPVLAFAEGNVLAIIFFSILLGVGIIGIGKAGKPMADLFNSASDVVLKMTHYIMELAPFGVFTLVAYTAASQGIEALSAIVTLIIAVYAGLFVHAIVTYGLLIRVVLNLPLTRFFRGLTDPIAVAFSTASSAATLPVTVAAVTDNLGIKKSVAGSVLPLGATINMDGTALYLGILALFAAQAFGYDLTFAHYVGIAMTATLASIGTASVPSASLFLLAIVLNSFGVSDEHIAIMVAFILPVDRIMDMARTAVNVTGDAAVATAVAKWEGELDEEVFRSPAKI